jgi:hypothetical protein
MPSPFIGMDPFIERRPIWPDFHDRLLTVIQAALQPVLRPRYVALGQERLYVVESDTEVSGTDVPDMFELWRDEIRQPLIEIIEPAAGNRVITAIEVLSPDNKYLGAGRISYLQKREEYWAGGTNLVEIDLLREGEAIVRVSQEKLEQFRPWHYLVAITRCWPSRQEIHAIPLQRRLPRIAVPLGPDDKDVSLDLQAAFTRCWDEGPYPELLHYGGSPPGQLSTEDLVWCDAALRTAGFRSAPTTTQATQ